MVYPEVILLELTSNSVGADRMHGKTTRYIRSQEDLWETLRQLTADDAHAGKYHSHVADRLASE
jgi:anthranilate/para-aminobenzoate synthase component II